MSKAVIYGGLLACLASGVMAAELLPPAPSLDSPALRGRFEGTSGAYVRADASYGSLRSPRPVSTASSSLSGFRFDGAQLGSATAFGMGAGYQFNDYARVDVTGEYRASARYNATASYLDPGSCPTRCSDAYLGAFSSAVLMANGYGEIGSWFDVTPFLGVGLGVARIASGPFSLAAANGHGEGQASGAARLRLAFALMAGASYDLTPQIKLETSYRYLNMGSGQSGAISCAPATGACAQQAQQVGLGSHDVRIGLRYAIASGSSKD